MEMFWCGAQVSSSSFVLNRASCIGESRSSQILDEWQHKAVHATSFGSSCAQDRNAGWWMGIDDCILCSVEARISIVRDPATSGGA
nr:hypothetical protein CFP56_21831 [Quercus suber]